MFTKELRRWIYEETAGLASLVDCGAGACDKLDWVHESVGERLGLEIWPDDLARAPAKIQKVLGDMRNWRKIVSRNFRDGIMLIDSLEHLDKLAALTLLRDLQTEFRRILVFTTLGFHPQGPAANPHQQHLSGWTVEELRNLGFEAEANPEFHAEKGGAIFARWSRA